MATITANKEQAMTTYRDLEIAAAKAYRNFRRLERLDRKSPVGNYDTRKAANEAYAVWTAAATALNRATA